jgi:hypothetical protein
MKSSISRISGSVLFLAQDAFRRVFQTRPHQEEITKVDDKHGTENILPKAEICIKLELSHKMAPLMIYKYSPTPDEEKAHKSLTRETQFSTKVLSQ